jgi:DNA-binding NarL/FixJ family response regulator
VVVLTASVGDHVLLEAVDAGAAGFLSQSGGISELTAAVRAAAVGESVIRPSC